MSSILEKFFHLKSNGTSVKQELLAGFTTFITMAYIIFVNPQMMSASGMIMAQALWEHVSQQRLHVL